MFRENLSIQNGLIFRVERIVILEVDGTKKHNVFAILVITIQYNKILLPSDKCTRNVL